MKNKGVKIILLIVISTLFMVGNSDAFLNKKDIGTTGAQFLKLGIGGKANALGEAVTASVNDSTSICWNPAGLCHVTEGKLITLMHAFYIEGMFYDYITYAEPIKDVFTYGVGAQYMNYGLIKETDEVGTEVGDLVPFDIAGTVGIGKEIFGVSLGINAKFIYSKIKNTGWAIAFDAGGQYRLMRDRLLLGLVVQNLGTQIKFVEVGSSLPLNIKLGAGYKLFENMLIEADVSLPVDNTFIIGGGAEYNMGITDSWTFSPRVGYNTRTADIGGLKGISAGFGVNIKDRGRRGLGEFGLDYAFVPFGDLGSTHRISLSTKF